MKSLYELLDEFEKLDEKVRSANAFEYLIGTGEVAEKDIQNLMSMAVSIDTAIRVRGINSMIDELQLAQLFVDYYNPDLKPLYYKDIDSNSLNSIKESYKHWKGIRDSLQESFEEKTKNIFIEV